ncbi:MAG: DUF6364 family protein [Gemmatimonadota bacterium]
MTTKLTLRLDPRLIRRAKRYARERGKSLSRLVADYFALLQAGETAEREGRAESAAESEGLPPLTRSLLGALSDRDLDEADYRRHLEEKHG